MYCSVYSVVEEAVAAEAPLSGLVGLVQYLLMVQQSHCYQASDLGFWPLGLDALGVSGSERKKENRVLAMSIPRYNQFKKKI